MKENLLDTNIILRYLTEDIPEKASRCETLFRRVVEGKEVVEIPLLVIAEVLWTLTKFYKMSKEEAVEDLSIFIKTKGVKVKDKKLVLNALDLYKNKNISFTDAYLAVYSILEGKKIYSFDEDFDSLNVSREEP